MSTETTSNVGSVEHDRLVARRWIDAFNARDDAAEAAARTTDYIAHAPDINRRPFLWMPAEATSGSARQR
jgi:hypothetical protein